MRRTPVVLAVASIAVAVLASASHGQGSPPNVRLPGAPSPVLAKAIAAQTSHARTLRNAPEIVGSGVGLTPSGQPVITVFTTRSGVNVPKTIDGVRVQTVVTGMIVARSATARYPRPVPIGVSSGHFELATGTLGARVTNGADTYALSNNHVFAGGNMASIGDAILQPGPIEDGGSDPADRIGTLADYQAINFDPGSSNTIDAAIALTTPGDVGTATLPDGYGSPSSTTVPASVGLQVQKYGRTTGLTSGSINAVNVDVDVCYIPLLPNVCLEQAHFGNQFSIPDNGGLFSDAGDSGSLVVTQGSNNPVGLLFAGGDGLTIANPIDAVLQRFNVTIDSGAPSDGKPSAPFGLQATPGDGQISLSWNAPASDGGSPLTGYNVYRGTSPGAEGPTPIGTASGTTYPDTTAANGTTYYYKVTATNVVGEGPKSNEASATPIAAVTPTTPLAVLDNFNRANETLSDAGRWTNGIVGGSETGLTVSSNALACTFTTTCTAWRNTTQYGADAESYTTISTLPGDGNAVRLYLRLQTPGSGAVDGYMLLFNQAASTDSVVWYRITNGGLTAVLTVNQEFASGDRLLFRAVGPVLEAWRNNGSSWARIGFVNDATYATAGYAGVGLRGTTGRLDDYGARPLGGATAPTAPQSLGASAGNAQVVLNWSPPASDGGSSVASYKVYRSTSSGAEVPPAVGTASGTTYTDLTVANGTTYYYKVTAVNGVGEGPLSSEVSATPTAIVPPTTPLPPLDSFNRANESPLSDGGRWTNGIIGLSENGFNVSSNTLACSIGTTCTAWRNNAQYGADAEAWAKVTTLPGTGNAIRLYVRLQQPGSSAFRGYMLRTNQLAGTDQVFLERWDPNNTLRTLLTISQELAVGDTLLVRAQGATIEAWRNNGSSWARLGVVTDTTYPGAGYVGVGIRGTSGRLDDFGARTLGVAQPTAPSAPQNLQAAAGNGQVVLTWSLPASDGGASISEYKIYRSTSSGAETQISPTIPATVTGLTYTDAGLTNGQIYYYKVLAVNSAGPGPLSNEANATPTAPAGAPSAPQNLQAAAGNGQVVLTWSLPASDGGASISEYKIYRSTSSGAETQISPTIPATVTGLTYTDAGLTNGQIYYYKVLAVNSAGPGPLSNEANATPTAPAGAPSAPQNLQAAAGNGQVVLTWSLPASDGGASISEYKIYRSTSSGAETQISPTIPATVTGLTYTDAGLTNGQIYYYKVLAVNSAGPGPLSNEANATPTAPAGAPSAPQNLQAAAGNGQVVLTWSLPASDGGASISEYKIYRSTSSGAETQISPTIPATVTGLTYTDAGLTNGQIYYYKVLAVNSAGPGPLSNEANATPTAPAGAPSAPQNLQAAAGNGQVVLTWSLPASDGGASISEYKIYRSTSSGAETQISPTIPATVTGLTYTDAGLTNGQIYYYKVLAVNSAGPGPLSNEANATPTAPAGAPSAPQNLQAAAGNGQVVLTWSLPASDGGASISEYKIYRSTSSGAETQISPTIPATVTGLTYTDAGLTNGQIYYYKVLAVNSAGPGPLSNEANATPTAPAGAPSAPQNLQAAAGNGQVVLTWSLPASDGGASISEYKIYRSTSSGAETQISPTIPATVTGLTYTDAGLTNGQIYYYKVLAVNSAGPGPLSNEANATPTNLVLPVEPLPILDNFNRPNENPLSFAGRWGNGILGSSERSLRVTANQCRSTQTTTATAWWNAAQLGPDSESYVTIATRPGNGNAVRLYVRLRTPGSSAVDGYMLLYNQSSGTDTLTIYRLTNGALTSLQSTSHEVAAGTRLLLRARGNALEAWVKEGSVWSRQIRVTDSTYAGAGYVGVGLRGTTGRLDDFGAR